MWTVPESNRCFTHAKGTHYRYANGPNFIEEHSEGLDTIRFVLLQNEDVFL